MIDQPLSIGLVRTPVWTEESWALETVSTRAGKRKQVWDARRSTDISVLDAFSSECEEEGLEGKKKNCCL